jgi:hypothetical protein
MINQSNLYIIGGKISNIKFKMAEELSMVESTFRIKRGLHSGAKHFKYKRVKDGMHLLRVDVKAH